MLEALNDPVILSALAVVAFATLVRATFGFGDALVAMPLLVMVVGLKTATALVALNACTIGMTILAGNFRAVRLGDAARLILSTALGIPIGLTMLKGVNEGAMELLLAGVLLSFSAYQLIGRGALTLATDRSSYLFGFVGGILGGAYNTNGPAVVVYGSLRGWTPGEFRATLQGYFLCTGALIAAGHASAGLWTSKVGTLYAASLPILFTMIWLGGRLHRKLKPQRFSKGVYLLLAAIATMLLVKTLAT